MKKAILLLGCVLVSTGFMLAQQDIFKKYGHKKEILTLSKGKYQEVFKNSEVVQIGTVLLNTKTNKVMKLLQEDTTKTSYKSEFSSRFLTIDPLAEKYYSISPYVYCLNNPVNMVDPDGKYAVYHHYNFTYDRMMKLGYSKTTSDLVAHYASTYADNPGRALAAAQGNPYRRDIDYTGTSASQNTASKVSSSWHSMTADGENVTNSYAKIRGQQFGWGKIITAGEEAKKAGGIDNLAKNSTGMKALGQGIHALQDAQGHGGVNMEDHSLSKDISAPRSDIALSVTESALVITEVLSGNNSHLTQGLTLDVSGISQKQFNTIQGAINDALKSKDNVNIKFVFGN